MKKTRSKQTLAVHAGRTEGHHGAVSFPVYNASVYEFPDAETASAIHNHHREGYYYGRLGNPTQETLEKAVAELEHADEALAFASGMAAITAAVLSVVKSGDHIVALSSMYSTTTSFLNHLSENFGVGVTYVDATEGENYERAATPNTKLFWIETPSNPVLNISDISAIADIARSKGIVTVADNTFATPINQNPLDHGADLVVHSATKYLGGHSDLTAGILAGNAAIVGTARLKTTRYYGGNISPQTAWLVLRGIRTLALRMKQHNSNAYALADMLSSHSKVKNVYYPGLQGHRNHDIAARQMDGFGGMVSFELAGFEEGRRFIDSMEICAIATSLGGVESIAQHSASMTHATLTEEQRRLAGISEGLIRMSVGIEDVEDLKDDISNALERV